MSTYDDWLFFTWLRLILALGDRVLEQSELLSKRAERVRVTITETDYCVLS